MLVWFLLLIHQPRGDVQEHSFGVVPLKKDHDGEWQVLLIQHRGALHWGFPKGHAEDREGQYQAACRELQEETGLFIVKLLFPQPLQEKYRFMSQGQHIFKTVSYYVALVEGDLHLQQEEVAASKWVPLSQASSHLTFPQGKHLSRKVLDLLK